jgi:hypothetical protein
LEEVAEAVLEALAEVHLAAVAALAEVLAAADSPVEVLAEAGRKTKSQFAVTVFSFKNL